jgi:5'-3' exonuclease
MSDKWLLFDVQNVITKAFFAMDPMEHKGKRIEALHGFFYDLIDIRSTFQTDNVVFCFDKGVSKRTDILPSYKHSRKKFWEDMAVLSPLRKKSILEAQIAALKEALPKCGFRNVFYEEGFEADDIIARLADSRQVEKMVIVSTDKDLHQCLRKGVTQYDHRNKVEVTRKVFRERWALEPSDWPKVKAIAGDVTDDIPGVVGVAEKTAAAFMRDELPRHGVRYKAILEANAQTERNLKVVKLPFPWGTPEFWLQPQEWNSKVIAGVLKSLGIHTLRP